MMDGRTDAALALGAALNVDLGDAAVPPAADVSLLAQWELAPSILIGLVALQLAYLAGIGPLRVRYDLGEPVERWRIICFEMAILTIFFATSSPLHYLSDTRLFSAHMVQHLILAQVMPPLLLIGTPGWLLRPFLRIRPVRFVAGVLTSGVVSFFLFSAVFALWHMPEFYDAAMREHKLHAVQHLMFMSSAVILWWPIYSPLAELPRLVQPLQMLYLFLQSIPSSIIGALVTLVERPSYQWYIEAPRIFNISALDDQKLGGLIMWVPGSMIFWIFLTVVFFQWWDSTEHEERDEVPATA
ncbi:MAG: cytochrome c oxidase assembly protein [Chloroflexi bacterium]|nr:cytochrome c oxidase assembly protein [Chloroflexota bacterium]